MEFELVEETYQKEDNSQEPIHLLYLDSLPEDDIQDGDYRGRHGGDRVDYGSDDEIGSDDELMPMDDDNSSKKRNIPGRNAADKLMSAVAGLKGNTLHDVRIIESYQFI
jgi:hypothetical protein